MNLYDLFTRGDKRLVVDGLVAKSKLKYLNETWITLEATDVCTIRIRNIDETYMFRMRNGDPGWKACAREDAASLKISFVSHQESLYEKTFALDANPISLSWQWPVGISFIKPIDLVIQCSGGVRLFIHKHLSREILYQFARGKGVEIGPGPKPQIMPSEETSVDYIEELTQEEWSGFDKNDKYSSSTADWSRFTIGKASSIPCDDRSLDFIFSSHLFEHLANPIGHLAHWKSKLKSGGVVLAVVPDMAGCKDLCATPTTLDEIICEYKQGVWEPQIQHFERFCAYRKLSTDPEVLMKNKKSIHVHFYTTQMPEILEYAVSNLGYKGYDFIFTANRKDFHFILYA
jgi:SAM-dependent methyltransferase